MRGTCTAFDAASDKALLSANPALLSAAIRIEILNLWTHPMPFTPRDGEKIALVLQGGGALGSYQGGIYEELAKAGVRPGLIAGISIGAIMPR